MVKKKKDILWTVQVNRDILEIVPASSETELRKVLREDYKAYGIKIWKIDILGGIEQII